VESAGYRDRPTDHPTTSRRIVLWAGWTAFVYLVLGALVSFVRFFFPRAVMETPTVFKAGFPGDLQIGKVDESYVRTHRVWIVRDSGGIYALHAKCTHLGCTPVWREPEGTFKCPCHGSGFTREGLPFEGPAPRPLERVQIGLAADGRLELDTAVVFRRELGQWDDPRAFLALTLETSGQ